MAKADSKKIINSYNKKHPLLIGHRGASGLLPENTMMAFLLAKEKQMDSVEFDVHLSKDSKCVVIHDENLKRTTGVDAWVSEKTLSEIQHMDAGSWKSKEFSSARIPALSELFDWAQSNDLILNLEVKTDVRGAQSGLEENVVKMIQDYDLFSRVVVSSFNHYSLYKINQLDSRIELAAIFEGVLFDPWSYVKQMGAKAIHCHWPVAMHSFYQEESRKNDIVLRAWTVNSPDIMKSLLSAGVDVMSDDVDALLKVAKELGMK